MLPRFSLKTLLGLMAMVAVIVWLSATPIRRYQLFERERKILDSLSAEPTKVYRAAAGTRSLFLNKWNSQVSLIEYRGSESQLLVVEDGDVQLVTTLPRLYGLMFEHCDLTLVRPESIVRAPRNSFYFANSKVPISVLHRCLSFPQLDRLSLLDCTLVGPSEVYEGTSSLKNLAISGRAVDDKLLMELIGGGSISRLHMWNLQGVSPEVLVRTIQGDALEMVELAWDLPVSEEFLAALVRKPNLKIECVDEKLRDRIDQARLKYSVLARD